MKQLRRIGVVDLGTLTLRFDIFETAGLGKAPVVVHKQRASTRLGDELYREGRIAEAKQKELLEAFREIQQVASAWNVEQLIALGTSALREDPCSSLLVDRIHAETGIQLRLISGLEEAELTALGVLTFENLPAGNPALIDIGGGSTEVTLCKNQRPLQHYSFDLGASRLLQQFGKNVGEHLLLPAANIPAAKQHLQNILQPLSEHVQETGTDYLISSSGAARALERLIPRANSERLQIRPEQLERLIQQLTGKNAAELLQIPGMEASRLDVVLPGALALQAAIDILGARFILLSVYSLRYGALARHLQANR